MSNDSLGIEDYYLGVTANNGNCVIGTGNTGSTWITPQTTTTGTGNIWTSPYIYYPTSSTTTISGGGVNISATNSKYLVFKLPRKKNARGGICYGQNGFLGHLRFRS